MTFTEYINHFGNKPTFTISGTEDNRWRVSTEANNKQLVAYDKDIARALEYAVCLYVKEIHRSAQSGDDGK